MRFRIPKCKKACVMLIICLLIIAGDIVKMFSYADELATLFLMAYIFYLALNSKICREDMHILFCVMGIFVLGVLSSATSGVKVNFFAKVIDAFWLFKIYVGYIGVKYYLAKEKDKNSFIKMAGFLAKIFIIISLFGAIANIFFDLGMSDGSLRYGLRAYSFITGNSGHYGMIVAVCLAWIIAKENNNKIILVYSMMASLEILLTTKLMPILVVLVFWCLKYQKKLKKIKMRYMAVGAALAFLIGRYQITYYIKDLNHPRMRLLIFGFKTALKYFPLGSGFATYGSEMAKRYYSKVYIYWGFENYYGLSPYTGSCLNDNYIAMIAAQFGLFALLLFGIIMIIIYKQAAQNLKFKNLNTRNISAALYVSMLATSIMSGTFKGAIGMIVFMTMGLMISQVQSEVK